MKFPDKNGPRLRTKNFKPVTSEAVVSVDYHIKKKILEVEFKTGKIYHYLDMPEKVWNTFLTFAGKGRGLGAYINQHFKQMIDDNHNYYELIIK